MTALAPIDTSTALPLPALIDRAVKALANARTAAEVLEARDMASVAYDMAKKAARLGKAKQAHDELIAAAYRAQADALEIEAQAKRRLADEYDAAQERGEAQRRGGDGTSKTEVPTAADVGLTHKDIHEGRIIRDAEDVSPGIVRRTVDAALEAGEEPTKAKVRRAVLTVVGAEAPSRPLRGRDAVCIRVRESIVALAGLPPAAEVVRYFTGTDGAMVISQRLNQVAEWIEEFRAAWEANTHEP